MRNTLLALTLVVGAALAIGGCAPSMQKASEQAYDPSTGTQTVAFNNGIYQTRGEPLPLRDDQLTQVGTAEGFNLYRLTGGGAGGQPQQDILYIKTADGRYQALSRVQ